MRQNIIKKISLVLMLAVIFSGCKKWIDTDINIDPNNPDDVSLPLLLPATQASLAFTYGGDMTRFEGIWMQHISGVERQMLGTDKYQVLESDINNLWNTLYGGSLINLKVMMEKAEELDAKHYMGVAKTLTAFNMLNITSVWGDVPYSDALEGRENNLYAMYDSQQDVYAAVNTLLDEAIALFAETNPAGVIKPGADDLIYKGDVAKWTKLAKSLKVRAALHLSKKNGLGPVRDALNAGGLLDAGDDFMFVFGNAASEWNPRYQFDVERVDIRVGKRIVDLMNTSGDPRMAGYFAPNGDGLFVGSGPGEGNTAASFIGPAYSSEAAPVYLMNTYEVKFIEAEAFFGTDNSRAAAAYNDGVKASLAFHGVSDATWETANAAETSGTITLEKIMTGKYVAMFLNLETWTDWRRTGIPSLSLPSEAALTETPRRYLYPIDERLYNADNMPAGQTATSRIWWDSN